MPLGFAGTGRRPGDRWFGYLVIGAGAVPAIAAARHLATTLAARHLATTSAALPFATAFAAWAGLGVLRRLGALCCLRALLFGIRGHDAEIMLRVLEIVFGVDAVVRRCRITGQREVFVVKLNCRAA